jgi:GMP synthase (glutamine-hydrolysing)
MIIIIDFGSQTTHLIGRRIKELGVESKIIEPEKALDIAKMQKPEGIILSGGPASVYEENAPKVGKEIFELGIPVLGICYGEQLMAHVLDGDVKPGKVKEYGPALIKVQKESEILKDTSIEFSVWMSHGDEVQKPPEGFEIVASTPTIPAAAIENKEKKLFAIQFHPEVVHTQFGEQILKNFLYLCGITPSKNEIDQEFVSNLIEDIKDSVENEKAICALSGGVDSSVASLLVHKAIGQNLTSIYIDSGLMRDGETDKLREVFGEHYQMNVKIIDAKKEFLGALKGVTDPEEKRKVIGKTFIEVFDKEAKKLGAKFLVQGTIYPDVIESKGTKHSEKIKSHHNVGGLPENMRLILIEPLRQFYKDEVRKVGTILELPESITQRQPFPGPGLAVRVVGEVIERKLEILRRADKIVTEEIEKAGLQKDLWQYFAVFTGIWTTGVRGDAKVYGETIAVRAIDAKDAMSASWAKIPYEVLDKISIKIVNEIKEVNRVVYDISNKPPATMEWE